jgi:hypothetical protein
VRSIWPLVSCWLRSGWSASSEMHRRCWPICPQNQEGLDQGKDFARQPIDSPSSPRREGMRSPTIILVTDTVSMDAEIEGEGTNEHLQEQRARPNLGHRNGNGSRPSVVDLWAATDLRCIGMPDPSLDLQPDNPVLIARSPALLNATSRTQSSTPTLDTLRRLTIRATPLSLRTVGGRTPAEGNGASC